MANHFFSHHINCENLSDSSTEWLVSDSLLVLNNTIPSEQNHYIVSTLQVKSIIQSLKNRKSPGIDKISNNSLKALPQCGIEVLSRIYNACIKICHFPLVWKKAKIVAIPKPGKNPNKPDSYRPICLLNSMSKVLERIIKEKILDYIEDNNILPSQQFGFRPEHNTTQPLVRIKKHVKENINNGNSTAMVLLDIKSAFDAVWLMA